MLINNTFLYHFQDFIAPATTSTLSNHNSTIIKLRAQSVQYRGKPLEYNNSWYLANGYDDQVIAVQSDFT